MDIATITGRHNWLSKKKVTIINKDHQFMREKFIIEIIKNLS
jgi:hypothetical protein